MSHTEAISLIHRFRFVLLDSKCPQRNLRFLIDRLAHRIVRLAVDLLVQRPKHGTRSLIRNKDSRVILIIIITIINTIIIINITTFHNNTFIISILTILIRIILRRQMPIIVLEGAGHRQTHMRPQRAWYCGEVPPSHEICPTCQEATWEGIR